MPRTLSRWNNRETTLYVGNETYQGVVTRTLVNRTPADGQMHDTYLYEFRSSDGKSFVISAKTVRARGTGLEIKSFKNFVPYCNLEKRSIA